MRQVARLAPDACSQPRRVLIRGAELVEKKRGRGMFVNAGARQALMKDERQYFLETEWPKVYATIQRLGLGVEELMKRGAKSAPVSQPFPTRADAGDEDDNVK